MQSGYFNESQGMLKYHSDDQYKEWQELLNTMNQAFYAKLISLSEAKIMFT